MLILYASVGGESNINQNSKGWHISLAFIGERKEGKELFFFSLAVVLAS